MDNLFTWAMLNTLAGASALAFLMVSYSKRLVPKKIMNFIGTDNYAVIISFIVLLSATVATIQVKTWQAVLSMIGLSFFNAYFVAATASKINDKAIKENQRKEGE